jgi:hypothetical protein
MKKKNKVKNKNLDGLVDYLEVEINNSKIKKNKRT